MRDGSAGRHGSFGLAGFVLASCVVLGANPASAATTYEAQVLAEINKYRAEKGRPVLTVDATASSLAAAHSQQMMAARKLSHQNFSARRRQSGYSACAENVGWGRRSPAALVQAWKKSSAHNANLLNRRIRAVGIRQAGTFVTFFACG